MEEYGYDIIQTLITDIIPDAHVKKVCFKFPTTGINIIIASTILIGHE